jgi:predicted ester cyclase
MDGYTKDKTPSVTYGPTVSGGIGTQALRRFYEQHFLGRLPPSMRIRLLSRTAGPDRVVDELYVSFEHTQDIPWMLPGVPPTGKRVEVVLVSIVSMRGGQLYSEHTYWDQASVLVQIGLLNPKLVPGSVQGVDRLPVVGREAARRILHEDPEVEQEDYHNRLIRRANARARKNASSRASQADESAADDNLPGKKDMDGKTVLENRPAPSRSATGKSEQEKPEKEEDDGNATETESGKPKPQNGDHSATVEDGDENEDE